MEDATQIFTKTCTKCGQEKSLTEFHSNKRNRVDGRHWWCKLCVGNYQNINKDKRGEYRKRWEQKHPHKHKDSQRKYRESNRNEIKVYLKHYNRKKNYGIDEQQFQKLVKGQDNKCAICQIEMLHDLNKNHSRSCCVDHDHNTGIVRGLLCSRCNVTIGRFEDNITLLNSAVSYLTKAEIH